MSHVHDTFYVLEDGSKADPNDVAVDKAGVLRHKDGMAVAMRGNVPRTSGVGPAKVVADDGNLTRNASVGKSREMKPASEDNKGYRTRSTK